MSVWALVKKLAHKEQALGKAQEWRKQSAEWLQQAKHKQEATLRDVEERQAAFTELRTQDTALVGTSSRTCAARTRCCLLPITRKARLSQLSSMTSGARHH